MSVDPEENQRAALALVYCSTFSAERPMHALLRKVVQIGEVETARRLWCYREFVISWFPRQLPNGRIEPGWEPSSGFIASALAILQ